MEIVGRASAARKSLGKKPFLYTVILTKTDKASEKGLHKTERDVRLGTRDLALILKATLEEEDEVENEVEIEGEDGINEIKIQNKLNLINSEENENESEEEKKLKKQQLNRELNSLVPILKTSSLSRIGRDDVWKLLQRVIGH